MLAVAMFLLMGALVTEFGETERAFRFARAVAKGKRGYSAKIAIILNLIFAGMSGAAISAVCGLGPMMVDEMDSEGYDRGYGAAMSIAASTVGPVFSSQHSSGTLRYHRQRVQHQVSACRYDSWRCTQPVPVHLGHVYP